MKDEVVLRPSSFLISLSESTMPQKKQFDFITIAKGFAIICVVLGHFTPSYMPAFYCHLKEAVYLFHMPLFMLVAGFLFQYSFVNNGGRMAVIPFIRKKFKRLMVPYFFLSFCIAALNFCLQHFMTVKVPVDVTYICRLFYENVGGSAMFLWFLYTLFIIFVLTAFLVRLPKGRLWILGIACCLHFIPLPSVFFLDSVGTYYVYFIIGSFLYTYWNIFMAEKMLVFILALNGIIGYGLSENAGLPFVSDIMKLFCGLGLCLIVLYFSWFLSRRITGLTGLLKVAGTNSAYIYLLHMAGVYPVRLLYEKIGCFTFYSYGVALITAISAGCLIPYLVAKYVIRPNGIVSILMGESKKTAQNLVEMKK